MNKRNAYSLMKRYKINNENNISRNEGGRTNSLPRVKNE